MKSVIRSAAKAMLIAVLALILPTVALAKGPPNKITITGPGISQTIEITDSELLEVFSFYQFNDLNRRIEKPGIELGEGYHITRYIEDKGKLIIWDRVTYYFDPAGGLGYVFFDGLDPAIGTTEGQGEWYTATPAGSAAMRQILGDAAPTEKKPVKAALSVPTLGIAVIGSLLLLSAIALRLRYRSRSVSA